MGLSRRFLNVMMNKRIPGFRALHCIDLERNKLFNTKVPVVPVNGNIWGQSQQAQQVATPSPSPWVDNHKNKIGMIQLSAPIVKFQCSAEDMDWYINCFPLGAGRKVLCVDQSDRTLLYDTVTRQAEVDFPYMYNKFNPLPIFIPDADTEDNDDGNGSIYIMEARPGKERRQDAIKLSEQYEAFIYRRPTLTSLTKTWEHQLLPPPPFVYDPNVVDPSITSYAVLNGGSHIWISANGGAGTYCLDRAKHTWTRVGNWTLPFIGKAEYVPELKLWFGIVCGGPEDWKLGAADLSSTMVDMDSQPQLVGTWKEVADEQAQRWLEMRHPQFVNLGSGRFCIARFFHHAIRHPPAMLFDDSDSDSDSDSDLIREEYFTMFTGVDVVPCQLPDHTNNVDADAANAAYSNGNGLKVQLQMIKHNSRRHMSYGRDGSVALVL